MAEKVANLRIFEDEQGKMNKSLLEVKGGALVVSQFTLYGDARGQRRPEFYGGGAARQGGRAVRRVQRGVAEARRYGRDRSISDNDVGGIGERRPGYDPARFRQDLLAAVRRLNLGLSLLPRLPELDSVSFGIDKPAESPILVALTLRIDHYSPMLSLSSAGGESSAILLKPSATPRRTMSPYLPSGKLAAFASASQ